MHTRPSGASSSGGWRSAPMTPKESRVAPGAAKAVSMCSSLSHSWNAAAYDEMPKTPATDFLRMAYRWFLHESFHTAVTFFCSDRKFHMAPNLTARGGEGEVGANEYARATERRVMGG